MLTLRLTEAAEADLAEIWAGLAPEVSEQVATRLIGNIESHFKRLREFPFSGAARDTLVAGLRVTFHSPYAIYYMPGPEALVVVRVIHGARYVAALMERGAFRD